MTTDRHPWLFADDDARPMPSTAADVPYHRVYARQRRKIPRGLAAIALLAIGFVGLAVLFDQLAAIVDEKVFDRTGPATPTRQAAGTLALAALIPYCMVVQRVLYGVPAGSLHSVFGHFRFGVLARAVVAVGPPLLIVIAVVTALEAGDTAPWTTGDLIAYIVIGLLLIPLAAAGEEYGFRGFLFRVVGGWTRGERAGAALGIVVTTVGFTLIHGTLDPYLVASYLLLFGSTAIVTWRTGGLEVAVALHGVYNVSFLVLATALHQDVGGQLADRGDAVGSLANLAPGVVLLIAAAMVWWATCRTGPARTPGSVASDGTQP